MATDPGGKIDYDPDDDDNIIGKGVYGTVFRGLYEGQPCAIKVKLRYNKKYTF